MTSPNTSARPGRSLLRQQVVEGIKRYMLDNRLRPGDPLPTESELCAALGSSRSSVREAVKTLDALDIVEVRHGHGTYVGRLSMSALVESLAFRGLLRPDDDFQLLSGLVDVRELIERGMAGRIIAALDERRLDALDALVSEMAVRGAGPGGERDRAFHAALIEPLRNELIGQLSLAFWDIYAIVAPHLTPATFEDEQQNIAVHRAVVAAARAGDVDGFERALGDHYAPVRRRIADLQALGAPRNGLVCR